jgi:hypothetical protein
MKSSGFIYPNPYLEIVIAREPKVDTTHVPRIKRLCRNSVHGSRASPLTDYDMLKIKHLAVRLGCESKRPEHVEGRMANYDTVSKCGALAMTV